MANAPSVEAAREAAALHPRDAILALAYGKALLEAQRLPEAIGELQRALRLDYTLTDARFALGCAWLEVGEPDKALVVFDYFVKDDDVAPKIAAARAMKARLRSDAGYVRHLFDQFAAKYDTRMISDLGYQAPRILRELAAMTMPGRQALDILDLGCGTGLGGLAFKDLARRLDGIDLSPAMTQKARARGIYDRLAVGDIETIDGTYDLLIAADTLVYLGDLSQIFAAASRSLRPGGVFLFTAEAKDGDGFALSPKRRWRHSEVYLRQEAARAGFEVTGLLACSPRSEAGQPVEGFAAAFSRPS